MQTENKILKLDGGVGSWCSDKGVLIATPSLAIGLAARFNLDLRSKELDSESRLKSIDPEDLATIRSWYIAIDADFNQATEPVVLSTSPDISVAASDGRTILSFVIPNTNVASLIEAAGTRAAVALTIELGGHDSNGQLVFLAQFPLNLRNRVWANLGSVPPEVASDPEYLTAAQVKALIAEATRSTTPGPAGTTPHIGTNGNWWIGSTDTGVRAEGKDGKPGEAAEDGEDGKSAYQIAIDNGYEGTVTQWLEQLKGEPGFGLQIHATGEPAELHAYDDEKAGFVFACSVVDPVAKTTSKYYYVKASDLEGDWCEPPLIDTTYEQTAVVQVLPAVEFTYASGKEYLQLDLTKFPHCWLAAVTIDTEDGELQLLPGSTGIKKVLRTSEGMLRIWFGPAVPTYEKGRLYLTQFLGKSETEAPDTPTPDTPEGDIFHYGVITDPALTSVTQITSAHLEQLTRVTGTELAKTSLGTVPAGSFAAVIVPDGYTAYKDDGLGGLVPFSVDNGAAGTGANGFKVDGVGTVYGEFKLTSAEIFIYIKKS